MKQVFTEQELSTEKWRDIKGCEGRYQVSNIGRVRSIERITTLQGGVRVIYSGQILAQSYIRGGYLQVHVDVGCRRVHRLVAATFLDNPENKPEVNHIDADKENNRVQNLEWCTRRENIDHVMSMGMQRRGNTHGMSRISEDTAIKILQMDADMLCTQIARELSVSFHIVWKIRSGKTWKHLSTSASPQ